MTPKRVEVTWRDIVFDEGWHTQKQFDKWVTETSHNTVKQLGYLMEDEEDYLIIVDSYFEDESAYGTIHKIPKGCIVQVLPL